MSHNKIVIFALAFASILVLAYSNCGHQVQTTSSRSQSELEDMLVVKLDINKMDEVCEDSKNYFCHYLRFGRDLDDGEQSIEFPCVQTEAGIDICPRGVEKTFNSARAEEACADCSEQEREERYNFEEFTCANRAHRIEGVSPMSAQGSEYEATLQAAVDKCFELYARARK